MSNPTSGVTAGLDHLVSLPGSGGWALWKCAALRGAGFPAEAVLRLAAPESAAQADCLLGLEQTAAAQRRRAIAAIDIALAELRGPSGSRAQLRAARSRVVEGRRPKPVADAAATAALQGVAAAESDLEAAREWFARSWAGDVARTSMEIERVARWDYFREAVAWQSPGAVGRALDELVRRSGAPRNAALRRDEELVASYLQRYCVKNDTIGFFGPVGWAEIHGENGTVSVRPGPRLVEQREVYFETWSIDALAARLASEPEIRPYLVPRLRLGCYLSGETLYLPGGRELPLTAEQAVLIAACDGRCTAKLIAAGLARDPAFPAFITAEEVYALLADLADMGLVTWTPEASLELRPEETLRQLLAGVEPAPLRERVLAPLRELDDARRRLARAAGDAGQVQLAMRQLEETFTRLTGAPARRNHGRFYAARGPVYEECRRSAEVTFGRELLERLAPLGLLLQPARWVAGELACRVERRLQALHDEIRQGGAGTVDSFALVSRALPTLFSGEQRDACFVELEEELQQRWARVLALPAAAAGGARIQRATGEIAGRFAAAFGEVGPAFSLVRYFSPDVMIAARGEEAFRKGQYQLVLGEIHSSNTVSWSSFVSQHPCPARLLSNIERDLDGAPVIMPQLLKTHYTQRGNSYLVLPCFHRYECIEQAPSRPPCESLPAAEVVVERDELGLTARTRDGRLRFSAIELFGLQLIDECNRLLGRAFPAAGHQPRVTIDDLVIARERYRLSSTELAFAAEKDPQLRFLAVRRWARLRGLPRFSFYREPGEIKPCYLDLDSPIYVSLFARAARAAAARAREPLVLEEMLPAIEDSWLTDAEGRRYTCELRLVAVQPLVAVQHLGAIN